MSPPNLVARAAAGVRAAWREAATSARFRVLAWCGLPLVYVVLRVLRSFLDFVEARRGALLADPVLSTFEPHDVAKVVFPLMYATLLGGLAVLVRHPRHLVTGLWAYALMLTFRMIVMDLLPLEPPTTMIPLRDPFVEAFGEHKTLTRDLFFSGHTATLFLLSLALPTPRLRAVGFVVTALIATGVLAQHAHYTVDVVAAPFFAYASYRIARGIVGPTPPASPPVVPPWSSQNSS